MMFYSANQSHQCNQEQEDAHSNDYTHHPETGDPEGLLPSYEHCYEVNTWTVLVLYN